MRFASEAELEAFCRADRDGLLDALAQRRGTVRETVPARVLDVIIDQLLDLRLSFEDLEDDVLGLCDFTGRRIFVNRRIAQLSKPNTKIEGVVHSTKAHEIGHVRFPHHLAMIRAELVARGTPHAAAICRREPPGATLQPTWLDDIEHQADYYARIFLIPETTLLGLEDAIALHEAWMRGASLGAEQLWPRIFRIADVFQVTGSLVARRLAGLGWLLREGREIQLAPVPSTRLE